MLFGEYLVSNNVISEKALVTCLVEQARVNPAVFEIIFKEKLLTEEQQLQVFEKQAESNSDYMFALKELGFLTADLIAAIDRYLSKNGTMIGEILLNQKYLSIEDLLSNLDDYLYDEGKEAESADG